MDSKRRLGIVVVGWLTFLPVIWYCGSQIKEWLGSKDYVVPFNWGYVFFPFGLPLSLAFIALGIGILKINKLSRILVIVLNLLLIVVFTCFVPTPPTGLIDWLRFHCGLLYPITMLIVVNLPTIKEQFK